MIFVDTSFWIALRLRRDERHDLAARLARHLLRELVTSNHVRGETWTFLRRRAGHAAATDFLDRLDRTPNLRVVHVSPDLEDEALRWLRRHDGDFGAAGLTELRPE